MPYCTNCGKETSRKLCQHCGVKMQKTHHYCTWCGTKLDEHATICPNCQEPVHTRKIGTFISVILICLFGVFALFSLTAEKNGKTNFSAAIILVIGIVLLLPIVKQSLLKMTHNNKKIRPILSIGRGMIVMALFVGFLYTIGGSNVDLGPYELTDSQAVAAAVEIFHQEVTLKNEDSFTLNDSQIETEAWGLGEYYVKVVLDYSAQNGFGGMNRDTYTVEMVFDETTGEYTRHN